VQYNSPPLLLNRFLGFSWNAFEKWKVATCHLSTDFYENPETCKPIEKKG
jgi:hypothetical protein